MLTMKRTLLTSLVVLAMLIQTKAQSTLNGWTEVYVNAKIFTADRARPQATAIAIRDG